MVAIQVEIWIWYAVVLLVVFARFTSRYLQLGGFKHLTIEDICMLIVACLYTVEVNLLVKAAFTPSNLIAPEDVPYLDDDNIQLRIYGSKLTIALEQVYCATIWGCKGCLLLCYANLTKGLRQHFWVKVVAIYAFSGYLLMVVLYFAVWCQPFYEYWSVPAANPQCSTYLHHLITNMVFNVSSDLMMLCIPLPLLLRTQLPLRKKIILCFVFSLGMFCILSAVLNKFYSFTSPYGPEWVYWYIREVSTAVIVANIPHCWSLIRRIFHLRAFVNNADDSSPVRSDRKKRNPVTPTIGGSGRNNHYSMSSFPANSLSSRRWAEGLESLGSDTAGEQRAEMKDREMSIFKARAHDNGENKRDSQNIPLTNGDTKHPEFSTEEGVPNNEHHVENVDEQRPNSAFQSLSKEEPMAEAFSV